MPRQFKNGDVVALNVPYQPAGSDKSFTHGIIIGIRTMVEGIPMVYSAFLFNSKENSMLLGSDNLPEATNVVAENVKSTKAKNGRKKGEGKRGGARKNKKDKEKDQQISPSSEPSI